jgi:SAM-dependent methyltransferase
VTGDAEGLPFGDEAFDRIMNLGSVEHYEAPARAVREMARVLRPTGKAVILLPNAFAYQHALYVWRHGRVYDDGQPLQRYATDHDWRRLLEENGLRVVDTVKYQRVVPRTPGDLLWYLRRPRQLAQLAVSPLVPLHAANCFVYIAERRS